MRRQALVDEIRKLMNGFVQEVEAAVAVDDLHLHHLAENALLPVLKIVFECDGLVNLNELTKEPFPAIDLGDKQTRISFQISSRGDAAKVKETLSTFLNHDLDSTYATLYIYVLDKKQGTYSKTGMDKITNGRLAFNPGEHILDHRDLLKRIDGFPASKIDEIARVMRDEFGAAVAGALDFARTENPSADRVLVLDRHLHSTSSSQSTGRLPVIWGLGSYSELSVDELKLARKTAVALGSVLGSRGVRLVSGKSDMLDELAARCRDVAMSLEPPGPLPAVLDGKIRQRDLKALFQNTIGQVPDLAFVIGGGISRGRVAEECVAAAEANIPVFPFSATGGAAASAKLTALDASDLYAGLIGSTSDMDANDLISAFMKAMDRYI